VDELELEVDELLVLELELELEDEELESGSSVPPQPYKTAAARIRNKCLRMDGPHLILLSASGCVMLRRRRRESVKRQAPKRKPINTRLYTWIPIAEPVAHHRYANGFRPGI
jgi:hypothetical protein